jgi:hypothetical protein
MKLEKSPSPWLRPEQFADPWQTTSSANASKNITVLKQGPEAELAAI